MSTPMQLMLDAALFFFRREILKPGEVLELSATRRDLLAWWHIVARPRPDLAGLA